MALRNYRRWDTAETSYVPRYTSGTIHRTSYESDFGNRYPYTPYSSTYGSTYDRSNSYSRETSYSSDRPSRYSSETSDRPSRYSSEISGYPGNSSSYRFNFVTGSYTNDDKFSRLRDADQPQYRQQLSDLYLMTSRLEEDYRNIVERYNMSRSNTQSNRNYGGGLPSGYGPAKYSGPDRLPPAERYGLNERRPYTKTEVTSYDYETPHYDRKRGADYEGSGGDVLYNKSVYKGKYDIHGGSGEYDHEEYASTHPRGGYERSSHDSSRYGSGYDKSGHDYEKTGRDYDTDKYGARQTDGGRDRYGQGVTESGYARSDTDRGAGIELDGHDKKVYNDSGIDSSDYSPVTEPSEEPELPAEPVPVREPTPEPEVCVYTQISVEEAQEMAEEVAKEDAKEKPLCSYPLVATLTQTSIQVDKVAGEFRKSVDDEDESLPMSLTPLPTTADDPLMVMNMITTEGDKHPVDVKKSDVGEIHTPQAQLQEPQKEEVKLSLDTAEGGVTTALKDVNLSLDQAVNPLGVTSGVVQVGEETIVTETTEEVTEQIPAEATVPAEVRLELEPALPEGDVVVKPAAPDPVHTAELHTNSKTEGAEIKMTKAAEEKKEEPKKTEAAPVSLKLDSAAANILNKDQSKEEKSAAPKVDEPAKPTADDQKKIDDHKAADDKKAAQEKKIADAKKKLEDKKKADEDKKKADEDKKKDDDDKKKADDQNAADDKKAAQEKKIADAKKKLEDKKKADEDKKKADADLKKAEADKKIADAKKKLEDKKKNAAPVDEPAKPIADDQKKIDDQKAADDKKAAQEKKIADAKKKLEDKKKAGKTAAPKAEKPASPKADKPAAPKAEKPASPKAGKTAAPKAEKPASPKAEKPAAPKAEKPATPKTEKPAAAKDEKPAAAKDEKPAAPKDEKPAAAKDEKPAAAKDEKPATPKTKANKFGDQKPKPAPAGAPKKKKLW